MENDPHTTELDPLSSVTVILVVRDEENMIANCLETLRWADEVMVLDTGSQDKTTANARRWGARVVQAEGTTFAQWRNEAAQAAQGAWLLYIDADERITPALAKVIQSRVRRTDFDAFTIKRNNILFGRWMQHGGWQN